MILTLCGCTAAAAYRAGNQVNIDQPKGEMYRYVKIKASDKVRGERR